MGVVVNRRWIRLGLILLCGLLVSGLWSSVVVATTEQRVTNTTESVTPQILTAPGSNLMAQGKDPEPDDEPKPFAEVTEGFTVTEGVFRLYQQPRTHRAMLGMRPDQLNQNLLLISTLASGVGEAGVFRGWPVNDGLVLQFREAPGHRLQVVVPNLFFRDEQGQVRDRRRLADSFSDSVLFALPILSRHPDSGEMLIDLEEFLLAQDPANLVDNLPALTSLYTVNPDLSYLGALQAFPDNLEMETVLGLSGGGEAMDFFWWGGFNSLPDPRGASLRVRHSLSVLTGHPSFQPRPADQRVGYFITAYRAANRAVDPMVRYIQRWHLEKQDPTAALSPPKQPIVFWLENTIPADYRAAIGEGVAWWNAAFERAGFLGAIRVEQMPANAPWDPADVRYNVIRWSDSINSGILGFGPSRVNPLTGEILDADVILDANAVRYARQEYQSLGTAGGLDRGTVSAALGSVCQSALVRSTLRRGGTLATVPGMQVWAKVLHPPTAPGALADAVDTCSGFVGLNQMALGHLALDVLGHPLSSRATQEAYIQDFFRVLAAHEVGHVLGLRHNFLGSALRSPTELHDPDITRSQGMITSVMDYLPPNIAPPGQSQGDFFPHQLGVYDTWAIEYGYRPLPNPVTARRDLQAIADRSSDDPHLAYAPDEDAFDILDPKANPWDWSHTPLDYAAGQMAVAQAIWAKLTWFSLNPGESYGLLRQRVNLVFDHYLKQAIVMVNYVGGQRFIRTDPWSSRGRPAFDPIPAEDQRYALDLLSQHLFAADAVQLSPDLVRRLAPDRWWHQGQIPTFSPLDYPLYDQVLEMQAIVLSELLYGDRLTRLSSADLHTRGDHLTLAELFDRLEQAIWGEWITPVDPVPVSSLRRGLQRFHLDLLTHFLAPAPTAPSTFLEWLAQAATTGAPTDARILARQQLRHLQASLQTYQRRQATRLDSLSRAHLEDVVDRIDLALRRS